MTFEYQKDTLTSISIQNGIILPEMHENNISNSCVCTHDGKIIDISYTRTSFDNNDFSIRNPNIPSNMPFINETVIYGGWLMSHYGHFILEGTTRLYYYLKNNPQDYKIAFSILNKPAQYMVDFFNLLDIDKKNIIYINKHTQFKEVIIPEMSAMYLKYIVKNEYLYPFEYVANKVQAKNTKKIYLSRTNFNDSSINEEELEKIFKLNDFKILHPEKMSLEEQISYYKNCTYMAALNGTLPLNAVFCKNNATIIQLERSGRNLQQEEYFKKKDTILYTINANVNPLPVLHTVGPFLITTTNDLRKLFNKLEFKLPDKKINYRKYYFDFIVNWLSAYSDKQKYSYIKDDVDTDKLNQLIVKFIYPKIKNIKYKQLIYFLLKTLCCIPKYRKYFRKRYRIYKTLYTKLGHKKEVLKFPWEFMESYTFESLNTVYTNSATERERERVNIARKWLLNFNSISSMQKKRAA